MTRFSRNRKKRRLVNIIGLLLLALLVSYLIMHMIMERNNTHAIIAPIPSRSPEMTLVLGEKSSPLNDVINNALQGTKGSYGIVIKNIKTGESYVAYEHRTYESGSLYKLWIMAAVYQQIKEGILHKDDILQQKIAVLNEKFHIDEEVAEKTEGTITLSVEEALEQMITISDNYAALLLAEKVKLSVVAAFLGRNGLLESKVGGDGGNPTTTPYDTALFLEKLYKRKLIDAGYAEEMVELLKRQRLNAKIPKYLPDSIAIAHKTGELNAFSHDAGIVYTENGDYIIVILSETDSRELANERIAGVSKDVYNYFANLY